jgi:hypothetical protein
MSDIIFSLEGFWTIFTIVFIFAFFIFLGIKVKKLVHEKPHPLVEKEN